MSDEVASPGPPPPSPDLLPITVHRATLPTAAIAGKRKKKKKKPHTTMFDRLARDSSMFSCVVCGMAPPERPRCVDCHCLMCTPCIELLLRNGLRCPGCGKKSRGWAFEINLRRGKEEK